MARIDGSERKHAVKQRKTRSRAKKNTQSRKETTKAAQTVKEPRRDGVCASRTNACRS